MYCTIIISKPISASFSRFRIPLTKLKIGLNLELDTIYKTEHPLQSDLGIYRAPISSFLIKGAVETGKNIAYAAHDSPGKDWINGQLYAILNR